MGVGDYVNSSSVQEPLAENDEAVEFPPNPKGGKEPLLVGISCAKGTIFCMAVGEYTESSDYTQVYAEKFSGKTWTLETVPLPSEGFASSFGSIACPTSTECTAVGTYHNPITGEHYLGEKWTSTGGWKAETPTERTGIGYGAIIALSCPTSASECMSGTVYRKSAGRVEMEGEELNGTTWTPEAMTNPVGYTDIFTISDFCEKSLTACVSVGWYENSSNVVETQAQWWNGTSWKAMTTQNPTGANHELSGVSCLEGVKECFAVGKSTSAGVSEVLGEELKGATWSLMTLAKPTGAKESTLDRISCAPSVCYAVGWYVNKSGETSMLLEASL